MVNIVECGKDVFPDHPEWDVKCNQQTGHEGVCARFFAIANRPIARLSLKCRLYGNRMHTPCSGTTDDGTQGPCKCWCHNGQEKGNRPSEIPTPPGTL